MQQSLAAEGAGGGWRLFVGEMVDCAEVSTAAGEGPAMAGWRVVAPEGGRSGTWEEWEGSRWNGGGEEMERWRRVVVGGRSDG